MGPDDPFDTTTHAPSPTRVVAGAAGRGPMERAAATGALAGALLAMIGVAFGPYAAVWVAVLAVLGAGLGIGWHLLTSASVRAWLVRLLEDRS